MAVLVCTAHSDARDTGWVLVGRRGLGGLSVHHVHPQFGQLETCHGEGGQTGGVRLARAVLSTTTCPQAWGLLVTTAAGW